ncbi:MAG: DNA alkylation repair protein [Bacteroidales bacterium]|nr:DNA alkylation repair protein [Bacteroidales bacterium]
METRAIVKEMLDAFSDLGSAERREKSKTYFPTAQRVMGVTNPDIKLVLKEIRRRYSDWGTADWINLCKALVATRVFECQVMAYEMIGRDRKLLDALVYSDLADLGQYLDNWASVDHYTVGIYGVLWGKGVVKDSHIDALLESDNFWERRVAVVSTVALNLKSRGGRGDTPRTIAVCERVVDDHHDMIQKALSWALRELSKRDREAVNSFLERYEKRLANRVVREVNHKLDFGTKN